jgi:hypothetical protein
LNTFPTTLLNAIRIFHRLRVACFTPRIYHGETFTPTLETLKDMPTLKDLAINSSCTDAPRAPLITQIRGLTRLELRDPTRAILELLPDWLNHLSETLKELHLKVNLHLLYRYLPEKEEQKMLTFTRRRIIAVQSHLEF